MREDAEGEENKFDHMSALQKMLQKSEQFIQKQTSSGMLLKSSNSKKSSFSGNSPEKIQRPAEEPRDDQFFYSANDHDQEANTKKLASQLAGTQISSQDSILPAVIA